MGSKIRNKFVEHMELVGLTKQRQRLERKRIQNSTMQKQNIVAAVYFNIEIIRPIGNPNRFKSISG